MRRTLIAPIVGLSLLVACTEKSGEEKAPEVADDSHQPGPSVAADEKKPTEPAAPAFKAHQAGFAASAAPASAWSIDGAETSVAFTIVSNSAGPVTGRFPAGAKGWLDETGKGEVTVELAALETKDKADAPNPVRDARVLHAFFGVPLSSSKPEKAEGAKAALAEQAKVDAVWKKLEGILPAGVEVAAFKIASVDGLADLKDGVPGTITAHGNLVLWDTVETHAMFTLEATKTGKRIEAKSTAPFSIDLLKVLGESLRNDAFETMLAAGCAHQPGIQNEVAISVEKLVLAQP